MKRVNVRSGLKQRMNDMLGSDAAEDGDGIPGITPWSIQAAMITNLRRIVKALAGGTIGRPVEGLWMTAGAGLSYSIGAGFGFTSGGDIVVFETPVAPTISDSSDGNKHIYLKHKMGAVDGQTYADGMWTGFIGGSPPEDIVYDDFAASKKDQVNSSWTDIIIEESSMVSNDNYVYLGYITVVSNAITAVVNNPARGFGPNDSGKYILPGIHVVGESEFDSEVTFTEKIIFSELEAVPGGTVMNGIFSFVDGLSIGDSSPVQSGASIAFQNGSDLIVKSGATFELQGGSFVEVGGVAALTNEITLSGVTVLKFRNGMLYDTV